MSDQHSAGLSALVCGIFLDPAGSPIFKSPMTFSIGEEMGEGFRPRRSPVDGYSNRLCGTGSQSQPPQKLLLRGDIRLK
jgi:hypothetical protein